MQKILFLNLFFLSFVNVFLAESKVITLSEIFYYGKNLSENQACEIALKNAKNKAASSLGEFITSESILQCKESQSSESCKQFSNIWTESIGVIKDFSSKREASYDETLGKYYCKQTITANVIKSEKPDPNFDFSVLLNKKVFEINNNNKTKIGDFYSSTENLEIEISPLSEMFVNIFYYSPSGSTNIYNEKITRLFPNPLCENNYIKNKITIPNTICEQRFKLQYSEKDILEKNNKQEFLLLIATKDRIKFRNEYSIKSLKAKINEINRFDIRKKDVMINVYFNE
ncbi:MAG: hypothetical protein CMJ13_00770 [Pelagibacterales bacterium]|nr:hypothetical protein [Pelagibacterales bacterium]|tara:strand:- start:6 stop:863 length:858 start_codon:yes stop_codon:yes gene_type:complete